MAFSLVVINEAHAAGESVEKFFRLVIVLEKGRTLWHFAENVLEVVHSPAILVVELLLNAECTHTYTFRQAVKFAVCLAGFYKRRQQFIF